MSYFVACALMSTTNHKSKIRNSKSERESETIEETPVPKVDDGGQVNEV